MKINNKILSNLVFDFKLKEPGERFTTVEGGDWGDTHLLLSFL